MPPTTAFPPVPQQYPGAPMSAVPMSGLPISAYPFGYPPPPPAPKRSKTSLLLAILSAVLLVATIIIGLLYLKERSDHSSSNKSHAQQVADLSNELHQAKAEAQRLQTEKDASDKCRQAAKDLIDVIDNQDDTKIASSLNALERNCR
jgi:hypothetical protein